MKRQARQLIYSFLTAAALLILCITIRPAGLAANDGLSYYGSVWITVIPFAAAMLIYEYTLWKTSQAIGRSRKYHLLALSLKAMAVLTIGVMVTPIYFVEDFHSVVGLVLFLVQLGISVKLLTWGFHWFDAGLVIIEALALATGLYYAFFEHGLLLQTQVVFQVAFVTLLVRSLTLLRIHARRVRKTRHNKYKSLRKQ